MYSRGQSGVWALFEHWIRCCLHSRSFLRYIKMMVIIIVIQFPTALLKNILNEQAVLLHPCRKWNKFFLKTSCLFAVYLHLFYCNHSWKWWYSFCVYTANLVEKTLPAEGGNLFPVFQLVFNRFSLEHVCVFILK